MCKTRLDTKIHPRPGQARGCKVRVHSGSHHQPSRRCRIRGRSKTQKRQRRKVRGSGKPDHPSECDAEGTKVRGNPEFHLRHSRKAQDARETRKLAVRLDGEMMVQVTCKFSIMRRQRLRSLALSFVRYLCAFRLLRAQRLHGVDGRSPPGGNPTGRQSHQNHQRRTARKSDRIGGPYAIEHVGHQPRHPE